MPYVTSKPRCDVLDNLHMLFLYTREGHLLTFFYYCTVLPGNTGEQVWDSSIIYNISALQSFVYDLLRAQDCKHCYFEDEELKRRKQLRAWGITESNWFTVAYRVTTYQLIPNNCLYKHSWTTLQFRMYYFQNRLRVHMIRYSSSADRQSLVKLRKL